MAGSAWTIRIPKDCERTVSDLSDIHFQLNDMVERLRDRLKRNLLEVHLYDDGKTLLVVFLHHEPPYLPVIIYNFTVSKCTYINVRSATCDDRTWKAGLESFITALISAVTEEAKRAYSRSIIASTEIAPYFSLDEVDESGGV